MTRIKRGTTAHRRHRKAVKAAKGYRGKRSTNFRFAKNALAKAGLHSYTHRKEKKRDFRRLWISRINAACKPLGITYSRLISAMNNADVILNRKILAELAINEPSVFEHIVVSLKEGKLISKEAKEKISKSEEEKSVDEKVAEEKPKKTVKKVAKKTKKSPVAKPPKKAEK